MTEYIKPTETGKVGETEPIIPPTDTLSKLGRRVLEEIKARQAEAKQLQANSELVYTMVEALQNLEG